MALYKIIPNRRERRLRANVKRLWVIKLLRSGKPFTRAWKFSNEYLQEYPNALQSGSNEELVHLQNLYGSKKRILECVFINKGQTDDDFLLNLTTAIFKFKLKPKC